MWQCRKKQCPKVLWLQACNVAVNDTTLMTYATMKRKSWLQKPMPKHATDVDKCITVNAKSYQHKQTTNNVQPNT